MVCQSPQDYMVSCALGVMQISCCNQGLHSMKIANRSKETILDLNSKVSAKLIDKDLPSNPVISKTIDWLNSYFCDPSQLENIESPPVCPLIAPKKDSFTEAVWNAMVIYVTFGHTVSYQKLAEMAGYPGASRAVGSVMRKNTLLLFHPCHRVIRSDGNTGNFSAGNQYKKFLLCHEKSKLV